MKDKNATSTSLLYITSYGADKISNKPDRMVHRKAEEKGYQLVFITNSRRVKRNREHYGKQV